VHLQHLFLREFMPFVHCAIVSVMYAFERREKTLSRLRASGRVTVSKEARLLGVSIATLRRDLDELEREGIVRKVRGGAVLAEVSRFETHFDIRMKTAADAKQEIARKAAETIKDDSAIYLDHSTTCVFLAREIARRLVRNLIVLTNSLVIPDELKESKHTEIILTGGVVEAEFRALSGRRVMDALGSLNLHQAFFSVGGLSVERGLMTQIPFIAELVPHLMRSAAQVNVLADSSKFAKIGAFQLAPLAAGLRIITDAGVPRDIRQALERLGVELV
jgi:DeoR/GlpR family transcriptional regulator of sugar metabolism